MEKIKEKLKEKYPKLFLKLHRIKNKIKTIVKAEKIPLNNIKKKIYIFLAADYGNFGDIAITYAQRKYLTTIFPDYEIVEIPVSKFYNYYRFLKRKIVNQDIITIVGGGNLGNLYEYLEEIRRETIKTFKNNLIISFPQTMVFTKDALGIKSLKMSKKIYSKHKSLILFAREEQTYTDMKKAFEKNEVYLVPDIVLSLKNEIVTNKSASNEIGLCFRQDEERLLGTKTEEEIKEQLQDYDIKNISTQVDNDKIIFEEKYNQLFDFLNKISNVKIFITDRLHGMIFSYITQTPCIAFDNNNHKISGTYEKWLKDCNYIKLLNEIDIKDIGKYIADIEKAPKDNYDINNKFEIIEKIIKERIR